MLERTGARVTVAAESVDALADRLAGIGEDVEPATIGCGTELVHTVRALDVVAVHGSCERRAGRARSGLRAGCAAVVPERDREGRETHGGRAAIPVTRQSAHVETTARTLFAGDLTEPLVAEGDVREAREPAICEANLVDEARACRRSAGIGDASVGDRDEAAAGAVPAARARVVLTVGVAAGAGAGAARDARALRRAGRAFVHHAIAVVVHAVEDLFAGGAGGDARVGRGGHAGVGGGVAPAVPRSHRTAEQVTRRARSAATGAEAVAHGQRGAGGTRGAGRGGMTVDAGLTARRTGVRRGDACVGRGRRIAAAAPTAVRAAREVASRALTALTRAEGVALGERRARGTGGADFGRVPIHAALAAGRAGVGGGRTAAVGLLAHRSLALPASVDADHDGVAVSAVRRRLLRSDVVVHDAVAIVVVAVAHLETRNAVRCGTIGNVVRVPVDGSIADVSVVVAHTEGAGAEVEDQHRGQHGNGATNHLMHGTPPQELGKHSPLVVKLGRNRANNFARTRLPTVSQNKDFVKGLVNKNKTQPSVLFLSLY